MKLKNIVALALVAAFACLYAGSSAGAAVLAMAGTVLTIACAVATLFEKSRYNAKKPLQLQGFCCIVIKWLRLPEHRQIQITHSCKWLPQFPDIRVRRRITAQPQTAQQAVI